MSSQSIHVLLVEDNPTDALLLEEALSQVPAAHFKLQQTERLANALDCLRQNFFEVILVDLGLPDSQGLDTLVKIREQAPHTAIVVLTGLADEELGLKALQAGAQDYLVKGQVDGFGLARAIRYAIERQRAEAQFQAVVEAAPNAFILVNQQGQIALVNTQAEKLFGYSRQELLGQSIELLVPAAFRAQHHRDRAAFAAAPTARPMGAGRDLFGLRRDGSQAPVEIGLSPLTTAAGTFVLASVIDITERKQAEAALATERQRLRTLIDNLPDHIYLKDTEGRFITGNLAVARAMGVNGPEQLVGKTDFDFYSSEIAAQYVANEQAVIRSGQPIIDHEEPLFNTNGHSGWLLTTQVPLRDQQGQVVGLVGISRDITERKRIEQELRESAEHFRATFDQAFVGIAHAAPDGRWLRVNQKLCDMVGYTAAELQQRTYSDITHPDDIEADREYIRRTLAGEIQTYTREKRYIHKEGKVIWVNLMVSLVRDPAGQPQYFIAIIQDVTARRQAEAEIRRRNQELALLNQVAAACAANMEAETLLEIACRELATAFQTAQTTATLLNPEKTTATVVAEYRAAGCPSDLGSNLPTLQNFSIQQVLKHEGPLVVTEVQNDARLAPFHALLHRLGIASLLILPLRISGEVIGTLSLEFLEPRQFSGEEINLAWSVADQVAGALARIRLTEMQQRLSTAIEQAAESVIITDTEGLIQYVNPAFEHISGYSRAEALGKHPSFLGGDNALPAEFYEEMWATLRAGRVWRGRFTNVRKDGARYTEDATVTPVYNENGTVVNFVSVQRDVTRELQLEEQYHQAQKMEAMGRLSGGVAHDFNNLLVVIIGYSELLEGALSEFDPLRHYANEILKAGERAAGLTHQLLAFSRKQILQPKVLNLNDIVTNTEKMLRRLIGEDIDLLTTTDPQLGQVKIDPGQMEQIIVNLVINARDAMPQGGKIILETANVELDETYTQGHIGVQPGAYVLLAVSDTGAGMDAITQSRIFEPFFTTKEQGKGTGLGLSTVYGIVKQSNGDIQVYSEVGHGTTFKIYLPRLDQVQPDPTEQRSWLEQPGGTETILLVEDERNVRTLARQVLEQSGYTVLEAAYGDEALALYRQHRNSIHLLLTDVVMPGGMNGRELAMQLKAGHPKLKVLFMSGYTDDAIVHHGVLEADLLFMQKPFTPRTLLRKVRETLDAP